TTHIDGVYSEKGFGEFFASEEEYVAQVQALLELDPIRNRRRAYRIEEEHVQWHRVMCDVNYADAGTMHTRMGMDLDMAQKIVDSRHANGDFRTPEEIVTRGVLSKSDFDDYSRYMVAT